MISKLDIMLFSKSLNRDIDVKVLVSMDEKNEFFETYEILYLFNGMLGSRHDWIDKSNLMHYLENKNLIVVMPDGENAFYLNYEDGRSYSNMITEDLPQYIEELLGLNLDHEKRHIAGLSMGGYGALYNGLRKSRTYRSIGAFSPAIPMHEPKEKIDRLPSLVNLIEDNSYNPFIFMGCGSKDFLIERNRYFIEYLKKENIKFEYFEEDYEHEWAFWDIAIRKYLEFIMKGEY